MLTQPERGCLLVARPREGLGMFKNTGARPGLVRLHWWRQMVSGRTLAASGVLCC